MSRFLSYNTDDAGTGNLPLGANGVATLGPIEVGGSSRLAGSVYADQAGTMLVQQTFDYWSTGGIPNPTPHWDVTQSFTIVATTPQTIDVDVIAPVVQIVYTNGATPITSDLRIFLRAYGPGA